MRDDPERISDPSPERLNEAIDNALEGQPRAEQWQGYISALQMRRDRIRRDLTLLDESCERVELEKQLDELDEQIQALREEEGITRFVEDTVRFSYEVHRLSEG